MPQEVEVDGHFLNMVSRDEWGAQEPKNPLEKLEHPILKCIVTFNTFVQNCERKKECILAARSLQQKHMDEGADDIKYNFVIAGDGSVFEGRGWHYKPDPSLNFQRFRDFRLDIAYIGNYSKKMPDRLRVKFYYLIEYGVRLGYVRDLYEMYESTPDWEEFPDTFKGNSHIRREKRTDEIIRNFGIEE